MFGYGWLLLAGLAMFLGVFLLSVWNEGGHTSFDLFNRSALSGIGPRGRVVLGAGFVGLTFLAAWQGIGLIFGF